MSDDGGLSLWRMRHDLQKLKPYDIPIIMFYGDSHLMNLKRWLKINYPAEGPRQLDIKVMKRSHFVAVGGSNINNMDSHV